MIEILRSQIFDLWLRNVKDQQAKLRIVARLDRLAHGNPGDTKPVGEGVYELRLHHGPGYRIYYLRDGERLVVLLCGGDKSTQRADIVRAQQAAEEWKGSQT